MGDDRFTGDQCYLRGSQYATPDKLAARQRLHTRYSTAEQPWFRWMVDRVPWAAGAVIEVGCGPGQLWDEGRPPVTGPVVLTDLSEGMVRAAVARTGAAGHDAVGVVAAAEALPFREGAAAHVICNHMLYHVPRPPAAVAELARVVRPDGLVSVATNGVDHFRETKAIEHEVFASRVVDRTVEAFGLETGRAMLDTVFEEVELHRYPDVLRVTEPADLLAYMRSYPPGEDADEAQQAALAGLVDAAFAAGDGVVEVTKDVGLFLCRGPRRGPG